jgi:GNAT superfamily N-acetyltransferase
VRLDVRAATQLSEGDHRDLQGLHVRCFGPPSTQPPLGFTVAPASDVRYVVRAWAGGDDPAGGDGGGVSGDGGGVSGDGGDGRLVSCLWITERTILVGGRPARAAGLRGVRTDPAYRRRGFGRAAMELAADFTWRELRPELALLLSSEMAVPFYLRLGWRIIEGPVYCTQPEGRLNWTARRPRNPAMVIVPAGVPPPPGPVDLCGLPW